jgi:hypothetical protein
MPHAPARWSGLRDARQVRALETLREAVEELAPGSTETHAVPARQWGEVVVRGPGKRRLPGERLDRRDHRISATYDGKILLLTYRIEGERVDSQTIFGPTLPEVRACAEFFARHLDHVWWKAARDGDEEDASDAPPGSGQRPRHAG